MCYLSPKSSKRVGNTQLAGRIDELAKELVSLCVGDEPGLDDVD